jgi:hypothetical protein
MRFNGNQLSRPATQVDALLSRRVEGEEIFGLFRELEMFSVHDDISLPLDREGALDPRVTLARNRELYANRQALRPLDLESEEVTDELTTRLPGLAEPIRNVEATGVCWNRNSVGANYLSLCFEREVVEQLGEEQADIWDELPQIAGSDVDSTELEWNPFDPRMLVIALGASIGHSPISRIDSHIRRRTPVKVTLLPLAQPRQQEKPEGVMSLSL